MDESFKSVNLVPYEIITIYPSVDNLPSGVNLIGADDFWAIETTKGANVKIAILDTGCDINHPDLKDRIKEVRNFTSEDGGVRFRVDDHDGHGTHVAGTIAASTNNSGLLGVAPNASLYILKVLTHSGGTIDWLINAINYAIFLRVDIITMSLGTTYDDPRLHSVIKNAVANNISVVCAAGNSGDGSASTNEVNYPAAYPESICVGSVSDSLIPSSFTNSNDQIDLVAPGEAVVSTYPGNQYAALSGTSMATPHVTGALALIKNWSKNRFGKTLTEAELYTQLIKKTVDLGYDIRLTGSGMVYLVGDQVILNAISNS